MEKEPLIKCPYCGKKYTASQIYIPQAFFGKSYMQLDEMVGDNMDLQETYVCDDCFNMFEIFAKVSFECKRTKVSNFNSEYTTKIV